MKTMYNKVVNMFSLLLISLLFVITGCKPSSENTSSIIRNTCSPPCWFGIDPGIATREEVTELLNSIPKVNKGSIESTSTVIPNDSIKWIWNSEASDSSGRIFFREDTATLITIAPKEETISFKDVIANFGEPEEILVIRTEGERTIITILALYTSKGFGIMDYYDVSTQNTESTIEIKPEEYVKFVWYGEAKHFYNYLTNGQISHYPMSLIEEGIQKWNGYGEYKSLEW